MKKLVMALIALACAAVVSFSGCSGGGDAKAAWVGTWDMDSLSGNGNSQNASDFAALRAMGGSFYLDLRSDGTCTLVVLNQTADGTWEAASATSASIVFNGATSEMKLENGKITVDAGGTTMTFVKAASAASASSSPAAKASSSSSAAAAQAQPRKEATLGSTISFDGLTIKFGDTLGTDTLNNQFSPLNGATVIVVPVSIANTGSATKGLNMFAVKEFGPKGTELENVVAYFDGDARMAGDLRPGATLDSALYFLYDGNGDYYLAFGFGRAQAEVKIPVSL